MTAPSRRPEETTPDPALAGLAREVEALQRRLEPIFDLPSRIEQIASLLAQHVESCASLMPPAAPPASWLDLPHDSVRAAEELLSELAKWVQSIYLRFADAAQSLPECWIWHPDVVEELLWLHTTWLAAYRPQASSSAAGDWHDRQRPGVTRRIRDYAGLCSLERHQGPDLPTTTAPTIAADDVIPAIARWWVAHRDEPAPGPADQQLDAAHRIGSKRGRR
jgi:hypothetical protein